MSGRTLIRLWLTSVALGFTANMALDWLLDDSGPSILRALLVNVAAFLLVALWYDRGSFRARWKRRQMLRQPLVLDEDGRVHIPILEPGEVMQTIHDVEGRPLAAWVIRADGRVRLSSDWSTRSTS